MKILGTGVNAPQGFSCAGLRAGIKPSSTCKDMAMIYSEVPCVLAGSFTQNVVKGAPVVWGMERVAAGNDVRAVVVNTGIANTCTGDKGMQDVLSEVGVAAELLGIAPEEVLVGSTGVIGKNLPIDIINEGIRGLVPLLSSQRQSAIDASWGILTTDTKPKEVSVEVVLDGKTVRIGGMCKGSGMIHPNMGTMLAFITTDVCIERDVLKGMESEIVNDTFNMISVDGDESTNDTVFVMANGLAANQKITGPGFDYDTFKEALAFVNLELAKKIAGDGEGCTKLMEVRVQGAQSKESAKVLSKSVITSSLTKAAMYGNDANWGRILAALGYSGAMFNPTAVDLDIFAAGETVEIARDGIALDFDEDKATRVLDHEHIVLDIHLHDGNGAATAYGCDLTHAYIDINTSYRS